MKDPYLWIAVTVWVCIRLIICWRVRAMTIWFGVEAISRLIVRSPAAVRISASIRLCIGSVIRLWVTSIVRFCIWATTIWKDKNRYKFKTFAFQNANENAISTHLFVSLSEEPFSFSVSLDREFELLFIFINIWLDPSLRLRDSDSADDSLLLELEVFRSFLLLFTEWFAFWFRFFWSVWFGLLSKLRLLSWLDRCELCDCPTCTSSPSIDSVSLFSLFSRATPNFWSGPFVGSTVVTSISLGVFSCFRFSVDWCTAPTIVSSSSADFASLVSSYNTRKYTK